ncbi:MAG TPA: hypothetical protein VIM29_12810 [Bacillota bacterium]
MNLIRFRKLILTSIILLLLMLGAGSHPVGAERRLLPKVLIIDLPRLTFADLKPEYHNLTKLCRTGAVGVLVSRITGAVTPEKLYLNLNSGKQLRAIEDSRFILNYDEKYYGMPAGEVYRSLTGYQPPPGGAVYLGMPQTIQLNLKHEPEPGIGTIGTIFNQHQIQTGAIGNADSNTGINRAGSILLVDEQGLIDWAALGQETVVAAPGFPSGFRSNCEQIFKYWQQFKNKAQVISITLGDLERIEGFRNYLNESRKAYFRHQALREYDQLIGWLLNDLDSANTLVILYSVLNPKVEGRGERLSPVVIKHPDFRPGLLVSNSTRRTALVTGPDLLATVYSFLGIRNQGFSTGKWIKTIPGDWRQAGVLSEELDLNYQARWTLLPFHGYALIITVAGVALGIIFWPQNLRWFETLQQIYLFLLTIPAVFLVEALVSPVTWLGIAGWTLTLAVGLYLLVKLIAGSDHSKALVTMAVITVAIIVVDGLGNGFLELRSFWGYSAVTAARFYGVGNEYLGFLLGAYLVAVSLSIAKFKSTKPWLLWTCWLLMAFLLFCPICGANIGGGISAVVGLGLTNYFWLDRKISKKEIALLTGALLLMLMLVGIGDFLIFGGQMSHFGQLIQIVDEQGMAALISLLNRKWQLNLSLIAYTGWSYILICLLAVIPILYLKPPRPLQTLINKYPEVAKGFLGFIYTCIVAFFVNDSGIVTVATMFIFGFDMLLLAVIQECRSKEMTQIE